MTIQEAQARALEIREKYHQLEIKRNGEPWSNIDIMLGFVTDVGELAELVAAKSGKRPIEDVDSKLAHELSDCLWSVLVLAAKFDVNIDKEFSITMNQLDEKIDRKLAE
jgi:NTP pyrophosphatase (non-canonical NTP hydrolase)